MESLAGLPSHLPSYFVIGAFVIETIIQGVQRLQPIQGGLQGIQTVQNVQTLQAVQTADRKAILVPAGVNTVNQPMLVQQIQTGWSQLKINMHKQ